MSKHEDNVILTDILDAIDAVLDYTANIDLGKFMADRKTRDATYRNIEVMGEAVNRLSENFLNNNQDVPWSKMISSRNALIHGYDQIDDSIVWNIATKILPDLRKQIEILL